VKWRPRRSWAAACLLVGMFVMPVAASAADIPRVVQLRDDRVDESSALVDLGTLWVTTNDSGDGARLFVVNPRTGKTIGISYFHASVVDVEALAPAGPSAVWVGDIGDNAGKRKSVNVYRVIVGPGRIDVRPRAYHLVYPKGRPNAESLFVDRQGRLNVVTKDISGGVVYQAPARLSLTKPNRLQAVGRVAEFATDAALARDGKHLVVRGPFAAGIYTVPGFRRVGEFRLPLQVQGEGISIGPRGQVRVSSEGKHSAIRQVSIPVSVLRVLDPALAPTPRPSASPSPSASPTPSPSPSSAPSDNSSSDSTSGGGIGPIDQPWLVWCIPAVIALGALGIGLGLRRRTE
jgi:hypothetical protein